MTIVGKGYPVASATTGLACGCVLALTLMAGPSLPPASAQAARPAELTIGMLSLQQEFPESLHKITPRLLRLQNDLVKALRVHLAGVEEEARVGQRSGKDALSARETLFRELETLRVMEARSKGTSWRELLRTRIAVRSQALAHFKRLVEDKKRRFQVGEITRTDVELATASALKAEIMLEALKGIVEQ